MNAHHLHWRTDPPNTRCGAQLAEWAEQQGLSPLNEPDTDTTHSRPRTRPSTIDLAFSNIDHACAVVEEYLTTGSLHYTVCIEAPIPMQKVDSTAQYFARRFEDQDRGNMTFFLGGRAASDGKKWTPDMKAARAAIRFAVETKRLEMDQ